MKICPNCRSEVENNFDICWYCQYSFTEGRVISKNEFTDTCPQCNALVEPTYEFCPNCQHQLGVNSIPSDPSTYEQGMKIDCLRCKVPMFFKESLSFSDGKSYSLIGSIIDSMMAKESYDIYFCPQCGKIEFYMQKERKTED